MTEESIILTKTGRFSCKNSEESKSERKRERNRLNSLAMREKAKKELLALRELKKQMEKRKN